jgi:orotate phosphoribosyltransferase
MADSELTELARDLDARCRLRGQFVLRSGQVSDTYFDKYLLEADPRLLARVAARMAALIPDGTHLLGGLELGGIPLATAVSQLTGLPTLFVRKQAKTYGTTKLAEGDDPAGRRVTLIEDAAPPTPRRSVLALRFVQALGASFLPP